jgi:hypothetical protein
VFHQARPAADVASKVETNKGECFQITTLADKNRPCSRIIRVPWPVSNAEWYPYSRCNRSNNSMLKMPMILVSRLLLVERSLTDQYTNGKRSLGVSDRLHGSGERHRVFLVSIPSKGAQTGRCAARLLSQHTWERKRGERRRRGRRAVSWRAVVLRCVVRRCGIRLAEGGSRRWKLDLMYSNARPDVVM